MPDKMFSAFYSEPGEYECWSVVFSEGRSCKSCPFDCYRRGWSKNRVDIDNLCLVKRKRGALQNRQDGV